jgi:phosphoribosylformimino-5-aminoimidazole carboxamide ribotide isomerase
MDLIPALDLRGGRVVRLAQGDDGRRTVYGDDPARFLPAFATAGVRLAHVVDLDAAFGEPPQRERVADLLRQAAAARGGALGIQLGGGLRDAQAVAWALGAGCRRVVVGSIVVRQPDLFAELASLHAGRVVPALDVTGGELRIAGWREEAPAPLSQVCRRLRELPCPAVLVTDIERDGTGSGPNLDLARRVGEAAGLPALLSGGVASLADLRAAAGCPEIAGVVVGRALLEGAFTLAEALAACHGEEVA